MLLSASEILRKSIDLYKVNYRHFLKYIMYLFVPSAVLIALSPSVTALFAGATPAFLLSFAIAAGVVSLWVSVGLIRAVADCYEGRTSKSVKEELKDTTQLILPTIFISILVGLAILGGIILLIIPGIIFSIWFAFGTYAVVLDNKRGRAALSWSKQLVKGRWWATLWRLLLPGLVFGVGILLVQSLAGLPFAWLQKTAQSSSLISTLISIIGGLVATAAGLIVTPLATAAPVILYIELKRHQPTTTVTAPLETHSMS